MIPKVLIFTRSVVVPFPLLKLETIYLCFIFVVDAASVGTCMFI